jgi:hypothetical protein
MTLTQTLLFTTAIPTMVGMATICTGYTGAPLYCDGRISTPGTLLFHTACTEPGECVTEPWVALDITEYTSGRAHCGDEILLRFPHGSTSVLPGEAETHTLRARALDAGPLYPYSIADTRLPIIVDLPAHYAPFQGLSAPATIVNVSAIRRFAALSAQREQTRRRIPQ